MNSDYCVGKSPTVVRDSGHEGKWGHDKLLKRDGSGPEDGRSEPF